MVRHLPTPNDGQGRVETGAVKFGEDWAGLFIRGDNAINLRQGILNLIEYLSPEEVQKNSTLGNAVYDLKEIADIIGNDVIYG
jgi:hypothetical protein